MQRKYVIMWSLAIFAIIASIALGQSRPQTIPSLSNIPATIRSMECDAWYQKAVTANANTKSPSDYVDGQVMRYSLLAIACQQVRQP